MAMNRRQLGLLVLLTLMWGINWPMMKLSLRELSPLYFRALTMSLGALWLGLFFHAQGVRMVPRHGEWRSVALLGLPNMLGWHTASILGVKELASGRAAILGFTMPLWTVLLGAWLFRERLNRRVLLACAAVLLAVMLLLHHEVSQLAGRPIGVAWMLVAAVLWALGTLLMRHHAFTLPVQALTVWMMALSSLCLWALAWALEPPPSWQFSAPMVGSLVYGVLINYGFAQIIWFGLASKLPPATSAMSVMAIPLIGTLSAAFIVGEQPHWQDYAAVLCVTVAIGAVLLPSRNPST